MTNMRISHYSKYTEASMVVQACNLSYSDDCLGRMSLN
jgi:hypothetical protein